MNQEQYIKNHLEELIKEIAKNIQQEEIAQYGDKAANGDTESYEDETKEIIDLCQQNLLTRAIKTIDKIEIDERSSNHMINGFIQCKNEVIKTLKAEFNNE